MVLDLAFKSKDPNGVGDAVKIFLFPDLSPASGSEAVLLIWRWNVVFVGGKLTSLANTILLLGRQKFAPVESWDEAASQLEVWSVFCMDLLGAGDTYPATA